MSPGEEFKLKATPSQELLRKLAYLAAQDNDSVLSVVKANAPGRGASESRSRRTADTLLQMTLMNDPAYRAMYERVGEKLDAADRATLKALEEARLRETQARRAYDELQERAAQLPDGTRVYRTEDGKAAYDENGRQLTAEEQASVDWQQGQPSWEEREQSRQRLDDAFRERAEVEQYQERVGELKRRHAEGDLSPEELKELDRAFGNDMPEAVRRHFEAEQGGAPRDEASIPRTGSVASHVLGDSALSAQPPAQSAFAAAAMPGSTAPEEVTPVAPAAPGIPRPR